MVAEAAVVAAEAAAVCRVAAAVAPEAAAVCRDRRAAQAAEVAVVST